jgi:hypothetical protein
MYISGQSYRPVSELGDWRGGSRFGGVAHQERPLVYPQADRKQPLRSEHFICFRIRKNLRNHQVRSFFHLCQRVFTTYRRERPRQTLQPSQKSPQIILLWLCVCICWVEAKWVVGGWAEGVLCMSDGTDRFFVYTTVYINQPPLKRRQLHRWPVLWASFLCVHNYPIASLHKPYSHPSDTDNYKGGLSYELVPSVYTTVQERVCIN